MSNTSKDRRINTRTHNRLPSNAVVLSSVMTVPAAPPPLWGFLESSTTAAYSSARQGLPDCHGDGASVRRCMPHGSVIRTAKLITGHAAEGERWELRPGRSGCRQCPRSGSWAADGHQPRIIQRARTRQAAVPRKRRGRAGRQGSGRFGRPDRPSSYSGITLSDEGGLKRTHADPPFWTVSH